MPEKLKEIWAACKAITVYQLIVIVSSLVTFLAPAYFFVKPIVTAQAGEVMRTLMKQEGIDPDQIKELPRKVEEGRQAQTRIESDLSSLKAQNQQVIDLLGKLIKPQQ